MSKNTPYIFLFLLCLATALVAGPRLWLPASPPRIAPAVYTLCDSITAKKTRDSLQVEQWCDTTGQHPVWGYRFKLVGDFNGDGKKEVLTEYFTDSLGREIPKYYGENNISSNQCFEDRCGRRNFLWCKNLPNDSIFCEHLAFAENLGDLNDDGTDEIGVISENGDYSSLSHYSIYSFHKNKWNELLYIPTWEWMFPPTPVNPSSYYMFGHFKDTLITSDTLNQRLEKEMNDFDFVKKSGNGVIEFEMRNDTIKQDFYDAATPFFMRYNLKNNSFKMKLPEFAPNQKALDEMHIRYKKINQNEFLIDGHVYYIK